MIIEERDFFLYFFERENINIGWGNDNVGSQVGLEEKEDLEGKGLVVEIEDVKGILLRR